MSSARATPAPTVSKLRKHVISALANEHWTPSSANAKTSQYSASLVSNIYTQHVLSSFDVGVEKGADNAVVILELSSYLKHYLWLHFNAVESSFAHVMSMIIMLNERKRQNLPVWQCFEHARRVDLQAFVARAITIRTEKKMSSLERLAYTTFLITCYESLEHAVCRNQCLRLVSLPLWMNLTEDARRLLLKDSPELLAPYNALTLSTDSEESSFFLHLLNEFIEILNHTAACAEKLHENDAIHHLVVDVCYCQKFVELLIDLLAQLPTRRFFRAFLISTHALEYAHLHLQCFTSQQIHIFGHSNFENQLKLLKYFLGFEIDDRNGKALSETESQRRQYHQVQILQQIAFKYFRDEMLSLSLGTIGAIATPEALNEHLTNLKLSTLQELCTKLRLFNTHFDDMENRALLQEIIVCNFSLRESQRRKVSQLPIYPTEETLFDESLVPSSFGGDKSLALPKLNLQFLSMHDYLLRNFTLYRLESTNAIKSDVINAVRRLKAEQHPSGKDTVYTGWSRMATPIQSINIVDVQSPLLGETKPAKVIAEVTVNLSPFRGDVRREWEELKQHDVMFLLRVDHQDQCSDVDSSDDTIDSKDLLLKQSISTVRGAAIDCILDGSRRIVGEREVDGTFRRATGNTRIYCLRLDEAQYEHDTLRSSKQTYSRPHNTNNDVYADVTLLLRRKPKENNFRAVLDSVCDLMRRDAVLPKWFEDLFMGYGEPQCVNAQFRDDSFDKILPLHYTCLDVKHLQECFPDADVSAAVVPPFSVTYKSSINTPKHVDVNVNNIIESKENDMKTQSPEVALKSMKVNELRKLLGDAGLDVSGVKTVLIHRWRTHLQSADRSDTTPDDVTMVTTDESESMNNHSSVAQTKFVCQSYSNSSLYYHDENASNHVRFTPAQTKAICSGMSQGLTLCVGPPGTGKTDVAVQIMLNVFHAHPSERILLVTHSNHALNDLFEKLAKKDIDPSSMLRLGQGHKLLRGIQTHVDDDFSKRGRVNHLLRRRLLLLAEANRLGKSLGFENDVAHTCTSAEYFYLTHVLPKWRSFESSLDKIKTTKNVIDTFPFKIFFSTTQFSPQLQECVSITHRCFGHIERMFRQMRECGVLEVLRSAKDRAHYMLTKHARIVAMTCTHAALKCDELGANGFQFDTIVMEEAGQVLDIETTIPMLAQTPDETFGHRLKRIVLIGDNDQLPPIIQTEALKHYAKLDQSLFSRLIRLGVPTVRLDAQGRARNSLADLYRWRYPSLRNLAQNSNVEHNFRTANAGLLHEFQFVDVGDYEGQGESTPSPHFYQNLGEAEYVVQLYCYMRLCGYPASKISIIASYNGQKHLIRDVLLSRCQSVSFFGMPAKVSTVDRFQGQQNDYIILSLTRTRTVGHIRDLRRLVVALSRARLGLYVFGRVELFKNCFEMAPAINKLLQHPTQLKLVHGETHPSTRLLHSVPSDNVKTVKDVVAMGAIVDVMQRKRRD